MCNKKKALRWRFEKLWDFKDSAELSCVVYNYINI